MAAEAARVLDRIDSSGADVTARVDALNARFADATTEAMLAEVLNDRLLGRVALVSSFGTESAVLLDLVARTGVPVPVLFLDTGKHFPETLAYRDTLIERFALPLVTLTPDADELAARDATGLRWSYDPDGCCDLRKVRPLETALARFDASITGRKGHQATTRAGLPRFEVDGTTGRIKFNPLANWTRDRIAAAFDAHDLPRHPLEAAGYPSVGCSPCTSRVQPGEDPRSGRWRGWDKTECGIHAPVSALPTTMDAGDDPVF